MNWICWNIHNLSKKCVYLWVKSHWVLRKHSEYIVPSINQNLSLVHNHPSFSHLKSTNYKLFTLFLCPDISLIALHVWFLSPVLGLPCLHFTFRLTFQPPQAACPCPLKDSKISFQWQKLFPQSNSPRVISGLVSALSMPAFRSHFGQIGHND